jgi:type I restriction enzyme S subunit
VKLAERRQSVTHAGVSGSFLPGKRRPTSGLPWLDQVPQHWDEVKLTLVARLGSGHTPSRDRPDWWVDCSIPWITTGEVSQVRDDRIEYIHETRERISELGLANSAAELRPEGTVVLSRTASAGFSAIMGRAMATSQDFVTWTCDQRLRPRFLLLCLRVMRQDLLGRLAMGSTHKTIYMPDVQSLRVPLASIEDQDRIVDWVWDRLRRLDLARDMTARQIELLRVRRQALIDAAVAGKIPVEGAAR